MGKYIAKWGEKVFAISPSKFVPMHKLSTKFERKSDANKDTSGTAPTNTRGLELQEITLETTYLAGAGVDPRMEMESWKNQFHKYYPLYINGAVFGPSLLELDSINFPNIITDNSGAFLQVDAVITFIEYNESTKESVIPVDGGNIAPEQTNDYVLNITPSTQEKAQKKLC